MASEEKKAKSREKRAAKKAALQSVLTYVKENTDNEDLLQAVKLLTPGQRFGGTVRTGIQDVAASLFKEKGQLTEVEAFSELKLGRPGMRGVIKKLIRKRAPEDRLWVSFDPVEGIYKLEAEGENAPDGWKGYRPVVVEDMEIV